MTTHVSSLYKITLVLAVVHVQSMLYTFMATTALQEKYEQLPAHTTFARKQTTFLLYIAGRNNLFPFIAPNIEQLKNLGTTDNINILVYLNTWHNGINITQRFIVYNHKLVQVGHDSPQDSGDPATLIEAGTWAFKNFPAETTILCLWNHGSGILEVYNYNRMLNTTGLYKYNTQSNMVELDRTIGFLQYLETRSTSRGICYDDATRHHITNHEIGVALRTISRECLQGKAIDILCCDACLMASIELAYTLKPYKEKPVVQFMVSSQEVVLAAGYEYYKMLAPALFKPIFSKEFVQHIVRSFADAYRTITQDYTQSAIDLNNIDATYEAIDSVAELLIEGLRLQAQNSMQQFVKKSGHKSTCTHFQEPTYKDIRHLLDNMLQNISMINLRTHELTLSFRTRLAHALTTACHAIQQVVVAHASGKNVPKAHGLSIYLPLDERIHSSYAHTDFAQASRWLDFINAYAQHRTIDEE